VNPRYGVDFRQDGPTRLEDEYRSMSLPSYQELHVKRQSDIETLKEILREKEAELWRIRNGLDSPKSTRYDIAG
jgi:hypothetical protein